MSSKNKERIAYFDIAKALLIFIVIFHHESFAARDTHIEGSLQWNFTFLPLYASWFMPAFFFITGYCTNFEKDFRGFAVNNLRTLIWPAVSIFFVLAVFHAFVAADIVAFFDDCNTIPIRGFNWFLMALFLSKMLMWTVNHYVRNLTLAGVATLLIGIIAICMNDVDFLGGNYLHHRHAQYLTIFLFCGYAARQKALLNDKMMIVCSVVFLIAVLTCMKINGITPGIAGTWINFSVWQMPLHLLLAITGTMFILYVSKIINHCSFLESVGRSSLIFYLFHIDVLRVCIPLIARYFVVPTTTATVLMFDVLAFVATTIICCLISYAINNTILRKLIKL